MSRSTRCTVDLVLSDQGAVKEASLGALRPNDPEHRQALVKLDGGHWIYAYTPEALEDLANALNALAGEMRADRTAARARQERERAIESLGSALDAHAEAGVA